MLTRLCHALLLFVFALLATFTAPLAATPSPAHAQVLDAVGCSSTTSTAYGSPVTSGTLGAVGEIDCFTFSATSGDRAFARMLITSGSISPALAIYRPDDSQICSSSTIFSLLELECPLDTTGVYTLAVQSGASSTGNYNVYLQRLNSPVGSTPAAFNTVTSGSITPAPLMVAYSFSGQANDRILFRVFKTSGSLTPAIRVLRPDGSELCANSTIFALLEVECVLDATATYSLLVHGKATNGGFDLYLQRLNNPVGLAPVTFNTVTSGSLASTSAVVGYSFSGQANDRILFRVFKASGTLSPAIRVLHPDGSELCANSTIFPLLEVECVLDTTATFSVLIFGDAGTGGFNFYLQRLSNPVGLTPILFNTVASGSITPAPLMVGYSFSGQANDRILFRVLKTSGALSPAIRVLRPDGTALCANSTIFALLEVECVLDASATYTLLVHGDGTSGGFNLYLQRLNNPVGLTPTAFNTVVSASITPAPLMVGYSFSGQANDRILFRVFKTSGALSPAIRVLRPDGTALCANSTIFALLEVECVLDASATYTLLVHGDGTSGGFNLYLQRLNNPVGLTPTAFNTVVSASITPAPLMVGYSFSGQANDHILFRVFKTSGNLSPAIRVFRPDGTELCADSTIFALLEVECVLDASTTYTLLVHGDSTSGNFNLYLQRLNNPVGALSLTDGEVAGGTIAAAPAMNAYTLTGHPDESVWLKMSTTSGTLTPDMRLYAADGSLLCSDSTIFSTLELLCHLDAAGNATLLAGGSSGSGTYQIEANVGWYIGRHSAAPIAFAVEGSIRFKVSDDFSHVVEIRGDPTCLPHETHAFSYQPGLTLPIADGRFFAMNVPLDIPASPGHSHSMDIDGVFFDSDGNGTLDQGYGGFTFRSNTDVCVMRWFASNLGEDADNDGWSDSAEQALGSSPSDDTRTPENAIIPTTTLASTSVCEDFVDNDGDGLTDTADPGCPAQGGARLLTFIHGPERVSPGQNVTYVIEYQNAGSETAENVNLFLHLSSYSNYVSSSSESVYDWFLNTVIFNLGSVEPSTHESVYVNVTFGWGVAQGTVNDTDVVPIFASTAASPTNTIQVRESSSDESPSDWRTNLQPGDILFAYNHNYFWANPAIQAGFGPIISTWLGNIEYTHVGIYMGNNTTAEALPGGGTNYYSIDHWDTEDKVMVVRPNWSASEWAFVQGFVEDRIVNDHRSFDPHPFLNPLPWLFPDMFTSQHCGEFVNDIYKAVRGVNLDEGLFPWYDPTELYHSLINDGSHQITVFLGYFRDKSILSGASKLLSLFAAARDPNAKYADRETAAPGETINFTVEFENEGAGIAYGVYVTDTLEEDADASTLVLPPGEGGVYDPVTRTITWYVGEVGSQVGGQRHFAVNVRSDAECGADVTNYAIVYFPSVPETTPTNGVSVRVVAPGCDGDSDGVSDIADNCPAVFNPSDADGDGFDGEDILDGIDNDGDGLIDEDYEIGQEDADNDLKGDPCDQDDDNDSMIDAFEVAFICLNPFVDDAGLDPDGDGMTNYQEFLAATDPCPPTVDALVGVTLQGRPAAPDQRWVVPLHVVITPQGSTTPVFDEQITTDPQGRFAIYGLSVGTYRVWVKGSHTLASATEVTLVAGDNDVVIATLLEGDANDNNSVTIIDFSLLATSFGKVSGQPGYNAQADFNQDGAVTILDFSLLAANFGRVGDPVN